MKRVVWIGLGFLALLALLLVVVPAFVDLGRFKSTYLPLVEETLHRRVDVSEVRLALVPAPSIRLTGLQISDSPAFPANTFFAAREVQLRLKLWPLLRGRFEVTQFILDQPVMNLLRDPGGAFNYADLANKISPSTRKAERGSRAPTAKSSESLALPLALPSRMRIRDGQLNLETKGQQPVRVNGIDLALENFTDGRPFPYRASFRYPGLRTISLEGMLDYREEQATLKLENNRFKIHDLDLPMEGVVTHVSTAPRFNLTVAGDSIDAGSVWHILTALGVTPRDTDLAGPMDLHLKLAGPSNGAVTELRGRFKNVNMEGRRAFKGKLSGEIVIHLPLAGGPLARRLQGNGKVALRDGAVTNADWIKKAHQMTGIIGLSKEQSREATTFKTLETDFTVGNGSADFKRIYMVNSQMEASGGGTMTLERPALNLTVETVLSPQASARPRLARAAVFFKDRRNRVIVPLKITGQIANPTVSLDTEKLAQKGMGRSLGRPVDSFLKQRLRR